MTPAGILETALYATDLDAAEEFYTTVLGLEREQRADNRHVFFRCGEGMLLIFNAAETTNAAGPLPVPTHGASGPGHVCFRASSDEIETWCLRLERHGVEIESDFKWPNGARSIYFRDPAGNSLEFSEPRLWGLK